MPTSFQARLAPVLWLTLLATPVAAQDYRAEAFTAPPPVELVEGVRAALSDQAVRVVGNQGPLMEIWFQRAVPAREAAGEQLGVAYPRLIEGSLIGAARVISVSRDFRARQVPAKVYTLRYALHPIDGNHMGVAAHRDFLVLSLADDDPSVATRSLTDLLAASKKASGSTHPAVLSLADVHEKGVQLPAIVRHDDEDFWVLLARVIVYDANGRPVDVPIALVVVGHAPEA
jgi:hypothetical protein